MSASNSEAQAATPGVLAAADAAAARVGEMSGFGALMGGTLFPQSTDDADRRRIQSIRVSAKAVRASIVTRGGALRQTRPSGARTLNRIERIRRRTT